MGRLRYLAVTFGGLMAGLAGRIMALGAVRPVHRRPLDRLGWIGDRGRGLWQWRPWWIVGGAFIFGAANALQYRLQAMDFPLPYQFTLMIPYVVTLIIVIAFGRGQKGPSALAAPYERSDF